MSDVVVDSCVVAKWFLNESDSTEAQDFFADQLQVGNRLIVLDVALSEVTNVMSGPYPQISLLRNWP